MQQWRISFTSIINFSFLLSAIPRVAALAWVADQSSSSAVYSYLLVGAPLMAV